MSPATRRRYPLTMICEVWRVSRSTVYAAEARRARGTCPELPEPKKRGPKTKLSDEELVAEIRQVLKDSDFLGEGPTSCGGPMRRGSTRRRTAGCGSLGRWITA